MIVTLPADSTANWGPPLRNAINAIAANVGDAGVYVGSATAPTHNGDKFIWFKDLGGGVTELWVED